MAQVMVYKMDTTRIQSPGYIFSLHILQNSIIAAVKALKTSDAESHTLNIICCQLSSNLMNFIVGSELEFQRGTKTIHFIQLLFHLCCKKCCFLNIFNHFKQF